MFTKYWDKCPTEILCQILSKLEVTTLLICMQVSSKWKDVAYYIVKVSCFVFFFLTYIISRRKCTYIIKYRNGLKLMNVEQYNKLLRLL